MIGVMAVSTCSCGKKETKEKTAKISAEELCDKIADASKNVEGLKATAEGEVLVEMSGLEVSAEGSIEMAVNKKPVNSYANIELEYDLAGLMSDNYSLKMYELKNEDSIDTYTCVNGEWEHESVDVSDEKNDKISDVIDGNEDIDFSEFLDVCSGLKVTEKDGKYIMSGTVNSDSLIDKMKDIDEYVDTSMVPDSKVEVTVTVNKKTNLLEKITFDVQADKVEIEGQSFEVKKCKIDVVVNSYGSVDITVPEEAKDVK